MGLDDPSLSSSSPRPSLHECIEPCAIFHVNHAARRQLCAPPPAVSLLAERPKGLRLFQLKKHGRYPVTENGIASIFPIESLCATRPSLRSNACLISRSLRSPWLVHALSLSLSLSVQTMSVAICNIARSVRRTVNRKGDQEQIEFAPRVACESRRRFLPRNVLSLLSKSWRSGHFAPQGYRLVQEHSSRGSVRDNARESATESLQAPLRYPPAEIYLRLIKSHAIFLKIFKLPSAL